MLRLLGFIFLFSFLQPLLAQEDSIQQVEILSTVEMLGRMTDSSHVKDLKGNVRLQQGNVTLDCDKAILYEPSNNVSAKGSIHINHADSIHAYASKLEFNGAKRIATLLDTVRLKDQSMEITTDRLTYDLNSKIAKYAHGGRVKNREIDLTSEFAYYYANTKNAYFKKDVVLVSNNYRVTTDTLLYNIESGISTFLAPTNIKSARNSVYCESGYYDSENGVAVFSGNAKLKNESQEISADSIWYDQTNGLGKAYGNVVIFDKKQNLRTFGSKAVYNEALGVMQMEEQAWFVNVIAGDSLFLSANKLKSEQNNELKEGQKELFASGEVRIFKSDIQGICDSLKYSDLDSSLWMYGSPVLWGEGAQFTADTIQVKMKNGQVDQINLFTKAMIISEVVPDVFDQISGRLIVGEMDSSRLDFLEVTGNGESVYFAQDDNNAFVGMNKAICGKMKIKMKEDKVDKITFLQRPEAVFEPISKISPRQIRLENFSWLEDKRPKNSAEVIRVTN